MRLLLHPDADSGAEIRFVHSHGAALAVALVGVVIAGGVWLFAPAGYARLVMMGAAGVMAASQLLRAVYRYELELDLRSREWRRRRGFAFAVRSDRGSLEQLDAVVLTQTHVSQGSGNRRRRVPIWLVGLEFRGWGGPVTVGIAEEEPAAYRLLEDYAQRLRVDAADRTGDLETRRPWDALDQAVRAQFGTVPGAGVGVPAGGRGDGIVATAAAAKKISSPPAGSGIEVTEDQGRPMVVLPPLGFDAVTVVAGLFGLAFAAFGAWALFAGLGVLGPITFNGEETSGPAPLLALFGGVFSFTGLSFAASGLRRARRYEWIRDEGERLVFGSSRAGKPVSLDALPKRMIEEVSVHRPRDDGGAQLRVLGVPVRGRGGGAYVRVRTDEGTVRLGARLASPTHAWLREAILTMAQS